MCSWNSNVPALEILRQQFILEDDGDFLDNWITYTDGPDGNMYLPWP